LASIHDETRTVSVFSLPVGLAVGISLLVLGGVMLAKKHVPTEKNVWRKSASRVEEQAHDDDELDGYAAAASHSAGIEVVVPQTANPLHEP
jgi:hypothetical protein